MNFRTLILSLTFCFLTSFAMAQVYSTVPPVIEYKVQPAPVTVRVIPRPSFYVRTIRRPFRLRNVFQRWTPVYAVPTVVNEAPAAPAPE